MQQVKLKIREIWSFVWEIWNKRERKQKQLRDIKNIWCIKNEDKKMLTKDKKAINIWKEHFKVLLNEQFSRKVIHWVR